MNHNVKCQIKLLTILYVSKNKPKEILHFTTSISLAVLCTNSTI